VPPPYAPFARLNLPRRAFQYRSAIGFQNWKMIWTSSMMNGPRPFLNNLEDPITQERIDLLTPAMKKHIQELLKARVLPDKLSDEFVQAIREALSDLKKVTIKVPDLKDALLAGGSPSIQAK